MHLAGDASINGYQHCLDPGVPRVAIFHRRLSPATLELAVQVVRKISGELYVLSPTPYPQAPYEVVIHRSVAELSRRVPEARGLVGAYVPETGRVHVSRGFRPDWHADLAHEVVHQVLGGLNSALPTWFVEGLAEAYASPHRLEDYSRVPDESEWDQIASYGKQRFYAEGPVALSAALGVVRGIQEATPEVVAAALREAVRPGIGLEEVKEQLEQVARDFFQKADQQASQEAE